MSEEVTVSYPGQEEYSYTYTRVQNLVKYTVIDVSDRTAPVVEREIYVEGNYHTARLVDGTVRSVTHRGTAYLGLLARGLLERRERRGEDGNLEREHGGDHSIQHGDHL